MSNDAKNARAPVLNRLLRLGNGLRALDERVLATNLSFILHERSGSVAVQSAVRAVQSHARRVNHLGTACASPATTSEYDATGVTHWLTAKIGVPHLLADALGTSRDHVILIDATSSSKQATVFFRADAHLTLPQIGELTVGVAALVLRPDRRTTHLAVSGVYDWPADRDGAIHSLERLIQAHAGQWMPQRSLWTAPAETLLPDEVY